MHRRRLHFPTRLLVAAAVAAALSAACTKDEGLTGPSGPSGSSGLTTGTISGQVTEAGSGAALSGVAVSTQPATTSVTTDAQGNYTISNVSPASYTVTAAKSGYNSANTSVTVTAGQASTANLVLSLSTGTISGKVTDAYTGAALAGADVSTLPATTSVTTDATGSYTISNVPAGSYTLTAAKSGYNSASTSVTVTGGQTSTADAGLVPVYDGSWSGPTTQGKTISFTIVNNAFTTFRIEWSASGAGCTVNGTTSITYSTPKPITSSSFTITSTGGGLSFTVTGTFSSSSSASGVAIFTFLQSFPVPCSATGSATWSATRP